MLVSHLILCNYINLRRNSFILVDWDIFQEFIFQDLIILDLFNIMPFKTSNQFKNINAIRFIIKINKDFFYFRSN